MSGRDWWRRDPVELKDKSFYVWLHSGVALSENSRSTSSQRVKDLRSACRSAIFWHRAQYKSGITTPSRPSKNTF